MKPYAQEPEDLRPFSKFTTPYYEHYTDLVEYNGAAREYPGPDLKDLTEIRIGFIGPISNHPDQVLGRRMLNGAQLAIDEANGRGGYCGKPFKLMLHNDSAIWGASSNEVVKMVYDDKVWAMFGSISGDTTHIALRVALRAEVPLVNSASTDPTIPETIIPWYFTDLQDDRVQGYTLARRIYTELGLKRIAILRINDRYGRFGVGKFRDASRRLGHPVVIEQKFYQADTDFRRQLSVISDSRVDGIVLWTDQAQTAMILKQMRELGMKQRVFGSHRTMGEELLKQAGALAEGMEAVYPFDPTRQDPRWIDFNRKFEAQYQEKADQFAALAYDAMQVLLRSICQAGLNRGRIRDALTGVADYHGVTGDMVFDPNCKNISPMYLASVKGGRIEYRRASMEKAYARVGEQGVQYLGPPLADEAVSEAKIAVFGPKADQAIQSPEVRKLVEELNRAGNRISLIGIASETAWGKATGQLVDSIYK
ncbi:MAG TPA: ABC transporter substrate-binding protein, partial [Bacteroidota bacterium]